MANVDKRLRTVFVGALLWLGVVAYVILYLHFAAEHRQARRELEYRVAHQQVAAQRQERQMAWEKQMRQERLRREYNQGRVAGRPSHP